jgi:hypothetical protein
MENYTFEKTRRRLIKSFLDMIILRALMRHPMSRGMCDAILVY